MIFKTPSLSTKSVPVFSALFKAQLPDTLNAIRQAIPEWMAVHVLLEGPPRRTPTKEEMRDELLKQLQPMAMLYDPIYSLTTPEIPANAVATFVPDELKPKYALAYQDFKYIHYRPARARLKDFFDRALAGIPEGHVGLADALIKGKIAGQAVLEGWTWSMALASYKRTMEGLVNPKGRVMFWDSCFGYETTGEAFLKMSQSVLGMLDVKHDRLYFDADEFTWFLVLYPGGQLRVGLLG
jgi:hypothetical protein